MHGSQTSADCARECPVTLHTADASMKLPFFLFSLSVDTTFKRLLMPFPHSVSLIRRPREADRYPTYISPYQTPTSYSSYRTYPKQLLCAIAQFSIPACSVPVSPALAL